MNLLDPKGRRLYLTSNEREAFLAAAKEADRHVRTFCSVLHFTGCRISEALALTPGSVDYSSKAIVFETLKKRRDGIYRAVPVPPALLDTLDMVHAIRDRQKSPDSAKGSPLIWDWSRTTAFRRVKEVMEVARIVDGPHKCPKGLRHGYGVHAISSGVPLNMLSKWMGHASLEVTAIYADALGEEQHSIAARMWAVGSG